MTLESTTGIEGLTGDPSRGCIETLCHNLFSAQVIAEDLPDDTYPVDIE